MPEPSIDSVLAEKKELRSRMLRQRKELPKETRSRMSREIVRRMMEHSLYRGAGTVMAYASMEDEVQLLPLMEDCLERGIRLAIPWIRGKGIMEAVSVPSLEALEKGAYGILTVREELRQVIPPEDIRCVIVPGAAFSRKGERLGLGGGYYDRFLLRAGRAFRVAPAFSFQLLERLPAEAHDVTMDAIITEQESLRIRKIDERT